MFADFKILLGEKNHSRAYTLFIARIWLLHVYDWCRQCILVGSGNQCLLVSAHPHYFDENSVGLIYKNIIYGLLE